MAYVDVKNVKRCAVFAALRKNIQIIPKSTARTVLFGTRNILFKVEFVAKLNPILLPLKYFYDNSLMALFTFIKPHASCLEFY